MKIAFHKNFNKQFDKLPAKIKNKVREKIKLFMIDPFNRRLNNHPLKGKYFNYRSINIGGDFRAIYKYLDETECVFVALGAHNQLYS
jgi:addiction module RelE/StbE family toxin